MSSGRNAKRRGISDTNAANMPETVGSVGGILIVALAFSPSAMITGDLSEP
jgi:hypothetical protein